MVAIGKSQICYRASGILEIQIKGDVAVLSVKAGKQTEFLRCSLKARFLL